MNRLIESVVALWVGTLFLDEAYHKRYPNEPGSLFSKVSGGEQ